MIGLIGHEITLNQYTILINFSVLQPSPTLYILQVSYLDNLCALLHWHYCFMTYLLFLTFFCQAISH